MSRIGKLPITVPQGVTVTIKDNVVTVKGKNAEMSQTLTGGITCELKDGTLEFSRPDDERQSRALHGLYRSLVNNMIVGCSTGYKKELELVGVGYRASNNGNVLELSLGYSHAIYMVLPQEIKVTTVTERNQNPKITLESADKALLGMVCTKLRSFRMPEPYKGKGILYVGEQIRRKSGKSAGAK